MLALLLTAIMAFFYGKYYTYILLKSNNIIEFLLFSLFAILISPFLVIFKAFYQILIDLQIPFLFSLYIGKMDAIKSIELTGIIKLYKKSSRYKRFCLNLLIKRFNKINNTTINEI